jgi:hypothetical protein
LPKYDFVNGSKGYDFVNGSKRNSNYPEYSDSSFYRRILNQSRKGIRVFPVFIGSGSGSGPNWAQFRRGPYRQGLERRSVLDPATIRAQQAVRFSVFRRRTFF